MSTPHSGVYALRHRTTGQLYIGSTKNFTARRRHWWMRMNRNQQNLAPGMRAITTSRIDWEFIVLWECGPEPEILMKNEAAAIDLIRRAAPERLLNLLPVRRFDQPGLTAGGATRSLNAWSRTTGIPRATIHVRMQLGWSPEQVVGLALPPQRDYAADVRHTALARMKTVLLDDAGQRLTTPEGARLLGCRTETLAERLRHYRERGFTTVMIAELRAAALASRRPALLQNV